MCGGSSFEGRFFYRMRPFTQTAVTQSLGVTMVVILISLERSK